MRRLATVVLLALAGAVVLAGQASAAPGDPFQFKYSFTGSELSSGGFSNPTSLAVNQATGNILVLDSGTIYQVDDEGHPVDFSGLGSPQISFGYGGFITVDNSGGPTQGNFYVFGGELFAYWAFHPDGTPIGKSPFFPFFEGYVEGFWGCGGGVGPNGNAWYLSEIPAGTAELTPEGAPTGRKYSLPWLNMGLCPAVFDRHGNAYIEQLQEGGPNTYHRFNTNGEFTDLGNTGLLATGFSGQLVIDPSTDDLYADYGSSVSGIHYTEPFVPNATPFLALEGIKGSSGMAFDATGQTLFVTENGQIDVFHREPPLPPHDVSAVRVQEIRARGAALHSDVTPGWDVTTYFYEYGTDTTYGSSTAPNQTQKSWFPVEVGGVLSGLEPGTTYHVRMVATNSAGTTYGPDKTFRTYPIPPGGPDPCANALERKQTGARALPDCRAFELVSARDTGGYDVESYLAPGQTPYAGFPEATNPPRVLYSTHDGPVPGPWNPTNRGPDPYLATRGDDGWSTQYVGLPADIQPQVGPFSSVLGDGDSHLTTFAFAGPGICDPCFDSGLETGIPLRLPSGQLVQGMAGSLDDNVPADAKPEGKVAKYLSADGGDLVFASKYAFEPGANEDGSSLTVYERDLGAGITQIVSRDENGDVLSGAAVSELDLSGDGSRVVYGQRVSEDEAGNEYVHPYMHIGNSAAGVDLAPGAGDGVLYAGMTTDGSTAFFTTADQLLSSDTDSAADLYSAAVGAGGEVSLSLLSPAGAGGCDPVANDERAHWNSAGSTASCDVVAVGGGGGVGSSSGDVYFLTPEQLDGGAGTADEPNLYLARAGEAPEFVATLDPDDPVVVDSVSAAGERRSGDFQVTPDGHFAVFSSAVVLTGEQNFGFQSIFRYDASADQIACASCDRSGTDDISLADDALLAPDGLSILEDGRVFFTTRAALVLNDANGRKDVYEWDGGSPQLISSGIGPFDSALLTVTVDGTDVYFFTHDTLAPEEDHNGPVMKIYDARAGGGFFYLPASVPCAASDECHGPSSPVPAPPDIKSSGPTTRGNVLRCGRHKVKRHGRCVKRRKHRKRRHGRHSRKKGKHARGKGGHRHA